MAQITILPTPVPQASDPTNFDTRADAFLTALPTFASEANILASEMNSMAQVYSGMSSTYPADGANISYNPGSGSLSLTVQKNKGFLAGQGYTMWASTTPATHYITGVINSYTPSTGAIVITRVSSLGGALSTVWILAVQGVYPIVTTVGSTMFMADNFGIF